jgi:peptide/nickel transport system permease protein
MRNLVVLLRRPKAAFGLTVLLLLTLVRIYAAIVPYDPVADVHQGLAFAATSLEHPLGTDQVGRDVLKRIVYSTRAFYFPGLAACALAALGGIVGGGLSGFYGGPFAGGFRYFTALVTSFPRFILILLVCSIYEGPNGIYVIAGLTGLVYLPQVAETIYRKVLFFRSTEFIEAARAHGLSDRRVLFYHILWLNCLPPILRHLLYLFGYVILIETSLSYLGGFGVQEPNPSWGNMLAQAREYIFQGQLLFLTVPAVAIIITIQGLVALGDAINEWGSR